MNRFWKFASGAAQTLVVSIGALALAQSTAGPRLGLLAFCGIVVAAIVLHEAGHAFAATLVGCRILWIGVGPFVIERRRRGFRVHIRRPRLAGFVFAVPDFAREVRIQEIATVAGGPAANLIAALALFLAAWSSEGASRSFDVLVLWVAGAVQGVMGIGNLMPYEASTPSDGALLRRWLKNEAGDDELRLLRLYDESLRGRIASEYRPDEIAALVASGSVALSTTGSYLALLSAQQRRDKDEFASIMARMREKIAQSDKVTYASMRERWMLFLTEEAFERARDGDVSVADRFIAEYGHLTRWHRDRLDAARYLAVNDIERASLAIDRARIETENSCDLASRRAWGALLIELSDELAERRARVAAKSGVH